MRLKDKVAIVTGSTRGIGKAIALALAREGAVVVVAARTDVEKGPLPGTIYKTAEEIQALGGKAIPLKIDVSSEEDVEGMRRKVIEEYGKVDILVNNAGIGVPVSFIDMSAKQWDLVVRVNLRGTFLCTKAVLPKMMEQRSGNIINLSSIAARESIHEPRTGLVYDVTKAGIERFTRGLAEEVKEYNIAVNAFCPGNTVTEGWGFLNPNIDKSDWQKPEIWGEFAVFLATRDARTFAGRAFVAEELREECIKAGWPLSTTF
jgi:NAD(P)-dependent dehydrogenase (short-subunit alcohol dehydrogenase family)